MKFHRLTPSEHLALSAPERGSRAGFTITELMVGLAISMIVLASVYSAVMALTRGSQSLINYTEMNSASRVILEQFARDARMGTNVFRAEDHVFSLQTNGQTVVYEYTGSTLTRTAGGSTRILIGNVEDLQFNYFTLDGDAGAGVSEVKQVQIAATVRRKVLTQDNTNHIISARFMLRNRRLAN